jgi:hypothetical protein
MSCSLRNYRKARRLPSKWWNQKSWTRRNVVGFLEGLSTRVAGFKVEAGFVAGVSSASETIIAERSLCRQWATFSHEDPQPGRGAQRVDEQIVELI